MIKDMIIKIKDKLSFKGLPNIANINLNIRLPINIGKPKKTTI